MSLFATAAILGTTAVVGKSAYEDSKELKNYVKIFNESKTDVENTIKLILEIINQAKEKNENLRFKYINELNEIGYEIAEINKNFRFNKIKISEKYADESKYYISTKAKEKVEPWIYSMLSGVFGGLFTNYMIVHIIGHGTASTGRLISLLYGAAKMNAINAIIGGGTIAMNGLGMKYGKIIKNNACLAVALKVGTMSAKQLFEKNIKAQIKIKNNALDLLKEFEEFKENIDIFYKEMEADILDEAIELKKEIKKLKQSGNKMELEDKCLEGECLIRMQNMFQEEFDKLLISCIEMESYIR